MKKLLLIDGNSMLFRAYYATAYGKKMTTSQGLPTNAIFGFVNMIQKGIDLIQPDRILVAFDAGKHTFRHEIFPDYKGTRKSAPEDLVPQFALVREFLTAYGIKWVEMTDIEADDLIGSMSKQCVDQDVTILSSDRDLLQLISSNTKVLLMVKGLSEIEEMNEITFKEKWSLEPKQIIDLKALMGDTSDNIPGIAGVGEKTALKLLHTYQTVENTLEHGDEIKGALGEKIRQGKECAMLSKTLATIKTDVELPFSIEECDFKVQYQTLVPFLQKLEMNSLAKKYMQESYDVKEESEQEILAIQHVQQLPKHILKENMVVYIDVASEPYRLANIEGFAVGNGKEQYYIRLEDVIQDQDFIRYLKGSQNKIVFDAKRAMHLLKQHEIELVNFDDVYIMACLVDSSINSVEKVFTTFQLTTSCSIEDIYGKVSKPKIPDFSMQLTYCGEMLRHIEALYHLTLEKLKDYQMEQLYQEIELPLIPILFHMEDEGVTCSLDILKNIEVDLNHQIEALQSKIYQAAGKEFNINSPKQLAEILYDDLGLPTGKKRSTSAEVLENFLGVHPIVETLLEYRKVQKIYSTYAVGLQKFVEEDGKIHTIYNQCATQTGRLSSTDPNLQNISVKDELGKTIRKAFLPSTNRVLISSDYHQIELRMLAHMANEQGLMDAFLQNVDVHTKTAMDVFGVSQDEVTSELRRRAKTVNFGIVYGISDFGLATQLGISRKEAAEFIRTYYEKYPGIKTYMDNIVAFCQEHGYVETLNHRRREIPEIHHSNYMMKEFGKRAAMNAPIQGSAADLIKIAMIHIDERMKKELLESKMILQVHDELIFDVKEEEIEQMKVLIKEEMENAMKLQVPLTVEYSVGKDWYEAK